ncbi:hypothetical protein F3Y22_tig00005259pilonHSYRG00007 [Hibiscus syriacus]|uniref:Uncharacterized protein n=1 Tax=Hibiscus syriacus TaxID=106335 RepID=A0A6A3CEV6_HIBSY|nr:hypothetical protein F3Y22_tig00005259pilonHSYRG00007 [Hibiscus syriacus]
MGKERVAPPGLPAPEVILKDGKGASSSAVGTPGHSILAKQGVKDSIHQVHACRWGVDKNISHDSLSGSKISSIVSHQSMVSPLRMAVTYSSLLSGLSPEPWKSVILYLRNLSIEDFWGTTVGWTSGASRGGGTAEVLGMALIIYLRVKVRSLKNVTSTTPMSTGTSYRSISDTNSSLVSAVRDA